MEEYFLRYETDEDFQSRLDQSILQAGRLGKQTAKRMRLDRLYRRAKGYRYVRFDGTEAPERKLKPVCSCRALCGQKVSNGARQVLLNNLLNLSLEGQDNFIYSHMQRRTSPERSRVIWNAIASQNGVFNLDLLVFRSGCIISYRPKQG